MRRPTHPAGRGRLAWLLLLGVLLSGGMVSGGSEEPSSGDPWVRIRDLSERGLYREALEEARSLVVSVRSDPESPPHEWATAERQVRTLEAILALPEASRRELARADSLNPVFARHYRRGEYPAAERVVRRQLEIQVRHLGRDHLTVAEISGNLGLALLVQGKYEEARSYSRQALGIRRRLLGPDHPYVAFSLNQLANPFRYQGDYAEAARLQRMALAIYRSALHGDEHYEELLSTLNNLSVVMKDQGHDREAERLIREALGYADRLTGEQRLTVAHILNNLSSLYWRMGDLVAAEGYARESVSLRREIRGERHPVVAAALTNLATILSDRGDPKQAEALMREALQIREDALGARHPDVAVTMRNLACLLFEKGDLVASDSLLRLALRLQHGSLRSRHPDLGRTLHELGKVQLARGDPAEAERFLVRATEIFEVLRLRAGTELERTTFAASPYPLLALARLEQGKGDAAWDAVEKGTARALADLLMISGQRRLTAEETAREDSLAHALVGLERRLAVLRRAAGRDGSTDEVKRKFQRTRRQLLETEAGWIAWQKEVRSRYPMAEGEVFDLHQVQDGLSDDTALLGWLDVRRPAGDLSSWGYVVRSTGPVRWVELVAGGASPDGSSAVAHVGFRAALRLAAGWPLRVPWTAKIEAQARDLWDRRIAPLERTLAGVRQLCVVSSGGVMGLPVETFIDSSGALAGDRYVVSYVPSATVGQWLQERGRGRADAGTRPALLVGDPALEVREIEGAVERVGADSASSEGLRERLHRALAGDRDALAGLSNLPRSREEVERISRILPNVTRLLGLEASEPVLVRLAQAGDLKRYGTIHLATHAIVDPEWPEQSALVLSQVDLPDPLEAALQGERIYDGLLTVQEMAREWKLDADLVVLSGCETALGKKLRGEGFIGFTYAFLQAGAGATLLSLWKVDDEATSLLMARFYEELGRATGEDVEGEEGHGVRKAEALRAAKRWLRTYTDEDGDRPFEHPAYWSSFILMGDPG